MRLHYLLALVPLLWIGACQPLEQEGMEPSAVDPGLIPLDSLPAEWGNLVAVIPRVARDGPTDWYELWFSEPTSGRITLVPVYRPELRYPSSSVYVIERAPAGTETVAPESGP